MVLIIERDKNVGEMLQCILEDNYSCKLTNCVENGVKKYQNNDIVLISLTTPIEENKKIEIDPVKGIKYFKEKFPNSKVIIMTAFEENELSNFFKRTDLLNRTTIVFKPIKVQDIISKINELKVIQWII